MIRCVLFDRDGTLGALGDDRYPETFTPFAPVKAVFDEIRAMGYTVGIITNQSSIARGTGADYDFAAEFASYGADIWKICPHDNSDNCNCRKPKSGMVYAVAEDLNIETSEILVIGDRLSDILCSVNAGGHGLLVLTGKGRDSLSEALTLYPDLPVLDSFLEVPAFLKSIYFTIHHT